MRISDTNAAIANDLRKQIHACTDIVSDGEGVAMIMLWSFLMDHATMHNMDVAELARDQLEAFITYAKKNITLAREH
jgi:hypothetical protein